MARIDIKPGDTIKPMAWRSDTPNDLIQRVELIVTCPACGSPDYEFDLDCNELDAHISIPCDECDQLIEIAVSVDLRSVKESEQ